VGECTPPLTGAVFSPLRSPELGKYRVCTDGKGPALVLDVRTGADPPPPPATATGGVAMGARAGRTGDLGPVTLIWWWWGEGKPERV
jgi:hypothetical protein